MSGFQLDCKRLIDSLTKCKHQKEKRKPNPAWLFKGQEAALLSPFLKQPQQTLPELPSESLHFHHTDDWLRTYCALHPSNNLEPSEQTLGADAILIPILQMRKVRHKRADTLPKVM